jgi:hypothetical protein
MRTPWRLAFLCLPLCGELTLGEIDRIVDRILAIKRDAARVRSVLEGSRR